MAAIEVIVEGLGFPEGPVVMADGSVIVVEIHAGQVSRCWKGRSEVVAKPGGGPNGAAIGPDGALWICNNGGIDVVNGSPEPGRIERIDLSTGKVERVFEACDGNLLSAPNDLVFDVDGQCWFTDLGSFTANGKDWGGLFCGSGDGNSVVQVKRRQISPNGVGLSPDMSTVYLADTISGRLYAFERRAEEQDGRYVGSGLGDVMFDSLAVTAAGNICVATLTRNGGITTFKPSGEVSQLRLEDTSVTNIAFGGEDMMDAYITFSGRGALVKMRWDEPGLKLVYNG